MRARELIEPHKGDKRYARRDEKGHFTSDQVDVGRSLSADRRSNPRRWRRGQGDRAISSAGDAAAVTVSRETGSQHLLPNH
jgi:hypothetical protein